TPKVSQGSGQQRDKLVNVPDAATRALRDRTNDRGAHCRAGFFGALPDVRQSAFDHFGAIELRLVKLKGFNVKLNARRNVRASFPPPIQSASDLCDESSLPSGKR